MKARLPAILLNADFFTKPRNRKWISDNGAEAVVILQAFWVESSQEKGCKIRKDEVAFITFPLNLKADRIVSILNSAVKVGLLDEDSDHYFNSQIVDDHKSFERKRKNYQNARVKRDRILPESSENPDRILAESRENHIEPEPEPESEYEIEDGIRKSWVVDLPCIKLERDDWDAWVLNFHHGNERVAREMCVAASDYLQAKGESLPSNAMAYLRGWYRKGLKFDAPKSQIQNLQQPSRPIPKEAPAPPPRRDRTPEEVERDRKLLEERFPKRKEATA